jgi:hypothetical protein
MERKPISKLSAYQFPFPMVAINAAIPRLMPMTTNPKIGNSRLLPILETRQATLSKAQRVFIAYFLS